MADSLADQLASRGYLTANGLVEYLHEVCPTRSVSNPTLRRMLDSGKIKAVKVGSQYRIERDEVERFIREGNREEGEQPSSSVLRLGSDQDSPTSQTMGMEITDEFDPNDWD